MYVYACLMLVKSVLGHIVAKIHVGKVRLI